MGNIQYETPEGGDTVIVHTGEVECSILREDLVKSLPAAKLLRKKVLPHLPCVLLSL